MTERVPLGLLVPFLASACFLALVLSFGLSESLFPTQRSMLVEDRDGKFVGGTLARDGQLRFPVPLRLSARYIQALETFEDQRFRRHFGFDLLALARASMANLGDGEVVSGASTLTMQLARLSRRSLSRTWLDKAVETVAAILMEVRFSKDEILRLYATNAPFGGNIVGVEAAAWKYFGRASDDLSWAEAAFLAVLPNAPGALDVRKSRNELTRKRDRLLEKLERRGAIDRLTLESALREVVPERTRNLPQSAPHALQFLAGSGETGRVRTTLDLTLQARVSAELQRQMTSWKPNSVHNAAALVLNVEDGSVLAYVGNVGSIREFGGANDMIQAPRSTGSLLKPFLYASMLETGELLPRQLVEDIPTRIGGYIPQNNVNRFTGLLPADEALQRSLNVPAVRELRKFGVSRFYARLKDWGMEHLFRPSDDYGLPLILGGAEGTLWELAGMYAGMAREARRMPSNEVIHPPRLTNRAHTVRGTSSGLSPFSAWLTLNAMKDLVRPGDDAGWKLFQGSRRVAWKTGTSFGYKDAWAIGVTPRYVVGVWVGNADGEGRPQLLGITAAAPILFRLFAILPATQWFENPGGSKLVHVCRESGYLAGPDCEETEEVQIPEGAEPKSTCPYHRELILSQDLKVQVDSSIYPVHRMVRKKWFVLPPVLEAFYLPQNPRYKRVPPIDPRISAVVSDAVSPLGVVFPEAESQVILPVELDGTPGKVVFEASHRDARSQLFWSLDGEFVSSTVGVHTLAIRPPVGRHRLTVTDEKGNQIQRSFTVLPGASKGR